MESIQEYLQKFPNRPITCTAYLIYSVGTITYHNNQIFWPESDSEIELKIDEWTYNQDFNLCRAGDLVVYIYARTPLMATLGKWLFKSSRFVRSVQDSAFFKRIICSLLKVCPIFYECGIVHSIHRRIWTVQQFLRVLALLFPKESRYPG